MKTYTQFIVYIIINRITLFTFRTSFIEDQYLILLKENQFLKRKIKKVQFKNEDRIFYAAFVEVFKNLKSCTLVTPETILKWHKKLIKKKWDYSDKRRPGRRRTKKELAELVYLMKSKNPRWGCRRIMGELKKLGIKLSKSTIYNILKANEDNPMGQKWFPFLKSHFKRIWAADYFSIETAFLTRLYVFFIIDINTKQIIDFNITRSSNSFWLKNYLRSFLSTCDAKLPQIFLTDNDPSYKTWMGPFLETYDIKHIQTPPYTPLCNIYAERMVRTFREELTDRAIFFREKDLRLALKEYILYYNTERSHSTIDYSAPCKKFEIKSNKLEKKVVSKSWLDGLITTFYVPA